MPEVLKMPSIRHLPWSEENVQRQQKWIDDIEDMLFYDEPVVMFEKIDGSQVCLTSDRVYGRSHGREAQHKSFDLLKKRHAEEFAHKIPDHLAVFGEWTYAVHSIEYTELDDYFHIFRVLDLRSNKWLSVHQTEKMAQRLDVPMPDQIATNVDGIKERDVYRQSPVDESAYGDTREGYVLQYAPPFDHEEFTRAFAKAVRPDHVKGDTHWKKGRMETNDLM